MSITGYSILDLSSVRDSDSSGQALRHSLELARQAEKSGFTRFWMAEHHNMKGIASSATAVALGYIAQGTETIRIGSGGVMLPNHAPLVIAEQFGTLNELYPGRVDLGLGRAPGTDQTTVRALRRDPVSSADQFPNDVQELLYFLDEPEPGQPVVATPGAGSRIPVWLLGSSLYSAQLAAYLGLPYAFAAHFAPKMQAEALRIYRREFQPSEYLGKPHAMICVNMLLADTVEDAEYHFTSQQLSVAGMIRNKRGKMRAPVENLMEHVSESEKVMIDQHLKFSYVGTKDSVKDRVAELCDRADVQEVMIHSRVYNKEAQLQSLDLSAQLLSEFKSDSNSED